MSRIVASLLVIATLGGAAVTASAAPAPSAVKAEKPLFTTTDTPLGDLLDDADAKAILQKHIPEIIARDGIDMARGMTLKQLQSYAGDQLTDAKLVAIEADLARISGK